MKERKEIKPVNITKNDVNYRQFLKSLNKIKSREDFLSCGVTAHELEEIISPFYKTLNDVRLAGYKGWVRSNKVTIHRDLKKLKKNVTIIAPDNAQKAETFDRFVNVLRRLKKSGLKNVMENHEKIAEKLFKTGAKKKFMYVKQYIKKHSNDLQNKIEDLSSAESAESESDEGEVTDDSSSVNSDKSESPKDIQKDDDISEIDKRLQSMDTDDSNSSNNSRLSKKIFEGFSNNVKQSTPKSSQSPSSPDDMEIDTLPHKIPSKIENDSGFNTMNRTSSGYSADISDVNTQGNDDSENDRSARHKADLSTIDAENQNKTGALLEVSSGAIAEDCGDDDHLPTSVQVEADLSRRISDNDAYNRSSLSKSSKKTPKRPIASVHDENNSISITEKSAAINDYNATNNSTWISMSRVEYSPVNHGRSGSGESTSSRSKRFKSTSSTSAGNDHSNDNEHGSTPSARKNTGSSTSRKHDRTTSSSSGPQIDPTFPGGDSCVSDTHSDNAYNRSSFSKSSEKMPKRSIASDQDENNSISITEKSAAINDYNATNNSTWISMSRVEYSPVNHGRSGSGKSTSSRSKRFKSTSSSAGNNNSNEQFSTPPARKNTSSEREIDPVFPGGNSSSANIRGNNSDDERIETALTRIDTNSSIRIERSASSVADDGSTKSHKVESDIFVTADETYNVSKENLGRDSNSSHSETSE